MLLFILLALIVSRLRGRRLGPLLRETSFIPLWVLEILFWVFQICAWSGIYVFVPYGTWLETAFVLSLIWPILKFRLYTHAFAGALLTAAGSFLNRMVVEANGGAMPVLPTLSKLTGYWREGALDAAADAGHMIVNAETKYGWLADRIDVGFSIMSIGDVLIHLFITIVLCGAITALNASDSGRAPEGE